MGNGLEVSSSTPNTIINEGNIQINLSNLQPGFTGTTETTPYYYKNFDTDGTTVSNGKNFYNKYTSNTSYGQVMFTNNDIKVNSGVNRIEGKMGFEQPYVSSASYNWLPISLPFAKSVNDAGTAGSILQNTFGITPAQYIYDDTPATATNTARYKSTVMKWSIDGYYYQSLKFNDDLKSARNNIAKTFILNLVNGPLKTIFDSHNTTTDRILYLGSPYGFNVNDIVLNTTDNASYIPWTRFYTSTEAWSTWKELKNPANERYKTYIGESFTTVTDNSTTYGKYLTTFGNPFTHNLDLATFFAANASSSNFKSDIKAIQKVGSSVTWNVKQGNTTAIQSTLIASLPDNTVTGSNPAATSKQWTGDKAALLLKPFEVAQLKFSYKHLSSNLDGTGRAYQYINGEDGAFWTNTPKTFNYTSSATITNTTPSAKTVQTDVNNNSTTDKLSAKDYSLGLYQLGLALSNKEETLGNRVYFVAIDKDVTGKKAEFELDYTEAGESSAIWANQENANETYDAGSFLYINGFNINDYVAKPLNITFSKGKEANTQFVITSNLAEGSTLNDGLENLSDGNKFFFVDKKENKTFEITKDFSYTFTATESSSDRFVVYWNALPKTLGTGEAEVNKNKTFIYKNAASSNSIRFAKKNLTVNIKIYNMSGQLVLSKDNVTTSTDYSINNLENGMYIVNLEYSDNTIETLKSIFKK